MGRNKNTDEEESLYAGERERNEIETVLFCSDDYLTEQRRMYGDEANCVWCGPCDYSYR